MNCLTPGCENSVRARGLCMRCYMAVYHQKKRENLNWRQLADQGRSLLKKTRCGKGIEKRILNLLAAAQQNGMTRTQLNWHVKITTELLLDMAKRLKIRIIRIGNRRTYYYPGMRPMVSGTLSFLQ